MHRLNRRDFIKLLGAGTILSAMPRAVGAQTVAPRVVVIGGGFGGATVAKYLRMWGGNVQVTLVDKYPAHTSCVLSNLVVTGALSMTRISLGYSSLSANHGVNVMQGTAVAVDPAGGKVTIQNASGGFQDLVYDHLVLAPGIDFSPAPGNWNPNLTPHAWQAGPQTTLLRDQLAGMRSYDKFVMTVPKSPYRCPPGPYERACVVADYLKRKGRTGAKVIVLDANSGIQAEPEAFTNAFYATHKGWIEYYPNANVLSIDSASKSISTSAKTVTGARVLNYIPNQKAGGIAATLGVNASGFVPVNPLSYAIANYSDIHVIGDSCAVPSSDGKAVPKSAHMANSEAKICADAILRDLRGEAFDQNIASSSACYSPITSTTASWLSTNFIYGDIYDLNGVVKGKGMHRVDIGEAPADRVNNDSFKDMFTWADSLFSDSFI
jgi:NADH dehydrogenase FAD-containing subunit